MNLKGRNFLTLKDFTPEEITYLLDLSAELKANKKSGKADLRHPGKNIALIFEKTSTRTRCSFEVAASIGALSRASWSSWQSTPVCRCGTD